MIRESLKLVNFSYFCPISKETNLLVNYTMEWRCFTQQLAWLSPEAVLLNKISCLTAALGVTKIITIIIMYWVTLRSNLDVQPTHLRFLQLNL